MIYCLPKKGHVLLLHIKMVNSVCCWRRIPASVNILNPSISLSFDLLKISGEELSRVSRRKRVTLDAVDHKLIEILKENSRASFKQIAKEVGLSSVAVRNRVNKLVKTGVIKGFFALVDPKALGRELSVIMDIAIDPSQLEQAGNILSKYEQIIRLYETSDSELHIHAVFRSPDELSDFLKEKVYSLPGVLRVRTAIVLKRHKVDPALML